MLTARPRAGVFMQDEDLITEAQCLPLVYCDGFGAFRKINGVLRCVGYVLQGGVSLNLAVSLIGADQAHLDMARVIASAEPVKCIAIWKGSKLAH